MSFPFLAHLGLRNDADERDIKRAYARLLKQIDQATDAAAFQALREAYEAALHWHRQGGGASSQRVETATGPSLAPPAPPPPASAPVPRIERPREKAPPRPPTQNHGAASTARPTGPATDPDVLEVFQAFMSQLTTHGDKASMRQALTSSLEDPRVQGLEARDMFEWLIAKALAKGWKPGHDILMALAIELFKWGKEPRYLMRFGQAGSEIDQSISDAAVFDAQPVALQERLKEVIRLLRGAPRGDDAAKAEIHRADLELLLVRFGSWLRLNAPAERVRQWRQWAQNPPERSALLADIEINTTVPSPRPPVAPQPKPETTPPPASQATAKHTVGTVGKKTAAVWFLLGLTVGMASMFMALEGPHMFDRGGNPWSTAAPPSNTSADPLDAVKAAYQPRLLPPGYAVPQRPPPYQPPPPPAAVRAPAAP